MARREIAHRIFASELNDCEYIYPEDFDLSPEDYSEKVPKYALTPIGAMVNRVYIVGFVSDPVEQTIDRSGKPFYKMRVSDGVSGERMPYFVYISSFQTQPQAMISSINPGDIIAISGKIRAFSPQQNAGATTPQGGRRYLFSIRPEILVPVKDINVYYRWLLDAAKGTLLRVRAIKEALTILEDKGEVSEKDIKNRGFPSYIARGVAMAAKMYGPREYRWYIKRATDALSRVLYPEKFVGGVWGDEFGVREFGDDDARAESESQIEKQEFNRDSVEDTGPLEGETNVLDHIKRTILDIICSSKDEYGGSGALKSEIFDACIDAGFTQEDIERAFNDLVEDAVIYSVDGEVYYMEGR